ncbi:cysteine hydrolase family protein [Synergistes jonesii]|uniref:Isochorismatase n=1 Tax=Synergistes jonesii TaxID=2754 RepID=A0A073IQN9_9BACT|nr:cysteine hydrolase family protein [Synergistes jonesii]KEJ92034.1 isochorismatase [Synergistes jonesii]OFB61977.1 isochorismatase [Synergistes jonesii]OFB62582.1 isochorismatase [Synergistes jonesii]OFB64271.1 isochorismatase [Synergistes jonesii]OFB67418.1 isochorismatase [Synergistes jonesii]
MAATTRKYVSFYYATAGDPPEVKIDPRRTCMLVVDMQNEFVLRDFGEALGFKKNGEWDRWVPFHDRLDDVVIPNTKKLIEFMRKNGIEVTYGRIACLKETGEDRCIVQKTPGWNNMLIPVNSYAAQMVDELKPMGDEIVVNKTTDSVVTGTNYATLIRNMDIETVIVTGIVTDQCVASTVRSLADHGFKVIVAEDCCAAATMELHDAELTIMNNIYCTVMSSDEIIELIKNNL